MAVSAAQLAALKRTADSDDAAAVRAEATAATYAATAKKARDKANASKAAYQAALTPTPVQAPPVNTKPAPVPTPAPTPTPPTPAPAPAPSPGSASIGGVILGKQLLDCVFARDGLKRLSEGGPWATRRQYGTLNDDPAGMGYDNRKTDNQNNTAFYSDRDLSPDMDPFSVASDGLHIAIREFTPAQKARVYPTVQEIQRNDFWSGQACLYKAIDAAKGGYAEVRLKTSGVLGMHAAFVLYSDPWRHEIDVMEVMGPSGVSDCSYHMWTGNAATDIHDNQPAVMADGSPVPNSNAGFVTFGVLVTPQRIRWYRNGVLTRDRTYEAFTGTFWLQLVNNAVCAQPWGVVGPMAVADLPRADLVVESVKVFSLG